jgi:hypothetical protein
MRVGDAGDPCRVRGVGSFDGGCRSELQERCCGNIAALSRLYTPAHLPFNVERERCRPDICGLNMRNPTRRLYGASTLLAVAVTLAAAAPAPALAAPPEVEPPRTSFWEAGQLCAFPIEHTVYADGKNKVKEFTDAEGNLVRVLQSGTTSTERFTNLWTGATVTIRGAGYQMNQTFDDAGGSTATTNGQMLVTLGSQNPDGPALTLYVGHLVRYFSNDATEQVTSFRGTSRDICAELS